MPGTRENTCIVYALELALQGAQLAACNRLHEVDERLARWFVDESGPRGLPLQFITDARISFDDAGHTPRQQSPIAAGILQKAGFITYQRWPREIENRPRPGRCCLRVLPAS